MTHPIEPTLGEPEGAPTASGLAHGALLTEKQIRWVRVAVKIMSVALIAGVALALGRIIYLVQHSGTQASPVSTGTVMPPASISQALLPEVRLALPAGAEIKSVSATGSRLAVLHTTPGGDAITVLDLATGQVVSRVIVERGH